MKSLKTLYKIGYGPSSSHTMGPASAAEYVLKNYIFDKVEIILYNSLALTGKGHLTDKILEKVFFEKEIIFDNKIDVSKHPNYFIFKLYNQNILSNEIGCSSIGGGDIVFDNIDFKEKKEIYPHSKFSDISKYCKENNISLYDYIIKFEEDDIYSYLSSVYDNMVDCIQRGLNNRDILPGPLKVKRKAYMLLNKKNKNEAPEITENRLVSAYAFAVNEENASGGKIVTAPTCGASGVLPSVLYYMHNKYKFIDKDRIIKALAVAGLIGLLIRKNATISGAVGGCQAEIGSATSMTAAAHATLFNLSIDQVEYSAEIAMEHMLGLTCDPVNGYVQIPCIERNAVAALRAINCCGLSFFLSDTRTVSFDTIVETMYQTGLDMDNKYKETSKGGLAVFYDKGGCW